MFEWEGVLLLLVWAAVTIKAVTAECDCCMFNWVCRYDSGSADVSGGGTPGVTGSCVRSLQRTCKAWMQLQMPLKAFACVSKRKSLTGDLNSFLI